jgi:hypothetical protein
MTCAELSQLIVRRVMERAATEEDPIGHISRATARLLMLSQQAAVSGDLEKELIKFGFEFGLGPELDTVQ